jgi:hypothetical protein
MHLTLAEVRSLSVDEYDVLVEELNKKPSNAT